MQTPSTVQIRACPCKDNPPRGRRGPVMPEVLHPVSLAQQLLQLRRIRIVLSACNARTISDAVAHAGHFQGLLRADYGRKDQQETKNQNLPHVIFSLKIKNAIIQSAGRVRLFSAGYPPPSVWH